MAMIRVKICGITSAADAQAAIDAGANLLGFNFYPKSPRHINEDKAAEIRRKLPKKVKAVGIVRPYGIDVASGVESSPGKKDTGRLREFIQEIRRVERE